LGKTSSRRADPLAFAEPFTVVNVSFNGRTNPAERLASASFRQAARQSARRIVPAPIVTLAVTLAVALAVALAVTLASPNTFEPPDDPKGAIA